MTDYNPQNDPKSPDLHYAPHDNEGRHPKYKHLVLFEVEPHYGMYILSSPAKDGTTLISYDEVKDMFTFNDGEKDFSMLEDGFAYVTDEYLDLLDNQSD